MILLRFNNIRGLRLFRLGRWQGEIWLCPRHEVIPRHIHRHMDSIITFLGGRMLFTRGEKIMVLDWKNMFRTFRVKAGESHHAITTGRFGLFINIECWTRKPTSAAEDFHRI